MYVLQNARTYICVRLRAKRDYLSTSYSHTEFTSRRLFDELSNLQVSWNIKSCGEININGEEKFGIRWSWPSGRY
jgi:hypothetical protein